MGAVEAVQRGAAGARIALVAIAIADVAEIAAARPLQDIAAERRHVAQLRAGGKLERVRDHRIIALDFGICCDVGHPRQRAEPQIAALEIDRGPRACERVDVDDGGGRITSSFIRSISVVPPASGWTAACGQGIVARRQRPTPARRPMGSVAL